MQKETMLFWVVTILTMGWIILMRPYTPKNIIAFELAYEVSTAETILLEWGAEGKSKAITSIYLDFIFILLYSTSIMFGCRVAAQFSKVKSLIAISGFLAIAIWIAGLLDVIENVCMLQSIEVPLTSTTTVAFYAASVKFSIVLLCLLFIITASITGMLKKIKG